MLGVILCGGNSTRMGTDKGLIASTAHDNETWAEIAIKQITSLGLSFVLSVNKQQYSSYSSHFPASQLIIDNDTLNIRGPLYGLLSVHIQYPDQPLLAIACDMPLMKSEILKELLQHYHSNPEAQAYLFTNNGEPEPLCAIYKPEALQSVLQLYHSGQLVKHSMKFMLDHISTFTIPLTDEQKKYFKNLNTHTELNGL